MQILLEDDLSHQTGTSFRSVPRILCLLGRRRRSFHCNGRGTWLRLPLLSSSVDAFPARGRPTTWTLDTEALAAWGNLRDGRCDITESHLSRHLFRVSHSRRNNGDLHTATSATPQTCQSLLLACWASHFLRLALEAGRPRQQHLAFLGFVVHLARRHRRLEQHLAKDSQKRA